MVKKRQRLPTPILAGEQVHDLLAAMGGSRPRSRLDELWQSWPEVIGPGLAEWVRPLGSHGNVLLLGAEDAMQLQELHFVSAEIITRANEFLGTPYFATARLALAQAGNICSQHKPETSLRAEAPICAKQPAFAQPSGKFLDSMDKASPVRACYALFAAKRR